MAATHGDGPGKDHEGHGGGAMTLRAATYDPRMQRGNDTELDAMTCDCCQTDVAMTTQGPLLVYRGRDHGEIRDILATRFDGKAWTPAHKVHDDQWKMSACPVNGPAVAARDDNAVVAWYTEAGEQPVAETRALRRCRRDFRRADRNRQWQPQ